jgi:hypothetical protein
VHVIVATWLGHSHGLESWLPAAGAVSSCQLTVNRSTEVAHLRLWDLTTDTVCKLGQTVLERMASAMVHQSTCDMVNILQSNAIIYPCLQQA